MAEKKKAVCLKMPVETWLKLKAIAASRNINLTALLNWIIAENLPKLAERTAPPVQSE